jgi:hypothetical protein
MLNFLIEEATVRHNGEGPVLSLEEHTSRHLLLALNISHVVERQNLDVDVLASEDGVVWSQQPIATFLQKFCCGTYEIVVPNPEARFLKAVWRVSRWGHASDRSLCRFSLSVQEALRMPQMTRVMAGAA